MRFEFATATRILFGNGVFPEIRAAAMSMGSKPLIVCGRNPARVKRLLTLFEQSKVFPSVFSVDGEPTLETARAGVEMVKRDGCDVVISMGGGSALDAGKAIAALATNPGDPLDYLEVIGKGQSLTHAPLPFIAIPTTAGTGAEVTRNAVLASAEHRLKVSLRHALMLPRLALVDPELTYDLPPDITASTGMDALTQVLEPFVSNSANSVTDALCREGMTRAARSLRIAYETGEASARDDMALTSLLGGLALANAKLGAVHGFAGVLGGMFDAPHGAICAALLPHTIAVNIAALRQRDPDGSTLKRYTEVAAMLTGKSNAQPEDAAAWTLELGAVLRIPSLKTYGISTDDLPTIVEKSADSSSMKGNPITLTTDEMSDILHRAL